MVNAGSSSAARTKQYSIIALTGTDYINLSPRGELAIRDESKCIPQCLSVPLPWSMLVFRLFQNYLYLCYIES